ncbi:MAG: exodeoxyribonuclease VII small subunit [Succinivibrio sp.]|uniref:exodeoxyribonuclease VII small subunit n=1 Tax=Succinivibrio sp. TaxID=2053619 RepID=UPI00258B1B1C|nr:exodeoxyribonuclease VII small subunit [Succinivibrio sp.]MCI6938827.1 exodeoxyribonuclease VII small subunit [Succinatimonas hippei]MDD6205785.1 exodeoxyribonuclease VII small subunit [Succinivibrio sp.]
MVDNNMTSLEQRLAALEDLTKKLEDGQLPIDQAIELYSKGMDLAVSCKKSLEELSGKIEVVRENAQKVLNKEP